MNSTAFASAVASGLTQDSATPTHDIWRSKKQRQREEQHFQKVKNAEHGYAVQLRKIARHVGEIIRHYAIGDPTVVPEVQSVLSRYAEIITPWAKATGARMIAEVNRRDMTAWHRHSQDISRALHKEVANAPIGEVVRQLQNDQVNLITSIPLEAAQRVQELTQQYVLGGKRYGDLAKMIAETTGVTMSRATLIARTETAKAASSLVQARAQHIGATHYIWHSVEDDAVRKMHKRLNGSTQSWALPPVAEENGDRHHPGNFPNCFTGEMLAGPLESCVNIFRAKYSGPLITLIAGETTVRVTPNHPILTPSGWLAAGLLKTGDNVIKSLSQCGDSVKTDVDNRLTSFEEIFELFSSRAPRRTLFVDNFYGDIVNGDVDIVSTKQNLAINNEAATFEFIRDDMIANANSGIIGTLIDRLAAKIVQANLSRFLNTLQMLFRSFVPSDGLIYLGLCPQWNFIFDQEIVQPVSRNTKFGGKMDFPFSRKIPSDQITNLRECQIDLGVKSTSIITNVEISAFDGHVYTLETDRGYYSVGSSATSTIIARNCRCFAEPIIPDIIV